jgi:hypothetical protein
MRMNGSDWRESETTGESSHQGDLFARRYSMRNLPGDHDAATSQGTRRPTAEKAAISQDCI